MDEKTMNEGDLKTITLMEKMINQLKGIYYSSSNELDSIHDIAVRIGGEFPKNSESSKNSEEDGSVDPESQIGQMMRLMDSIEKNISGISKFNVRIRSLV